jgi:hypothetical protein
MIVILYVQFWSKIFSRVNTSISNKEVILEKPTDRLKYEEHQLDDIWRWVCQDQVNGHGSCKTHYIEKIKKQGLSMD